MWDEPWTGTALGTEVTGTFSGGTFLFDDYAGSFTATWVGP